MLSNASMQQKKQNTTRLGSALTGSPSEPRSHQSITSDWQSTEVSDSTVFEREALHPQPLSCQEYRRCRGVQSYSTAPATVSASAAVLLRNSVVIDVHSERNGTNRLTVSFRSPRQLLPGVLLRFRCYNIYLDRVRIMRRYGINHRAWFLGPPRGQDQTQCYLFRSGGIGID